jgi:hypothetical protein
MQKAASHGIVSGSELAEAMGITAPYLLYITPTTSVHTAHQIKLAGWMSEEEYKVATHQSSPHAVAFAADLRDVDDTPFRPEQGHKKFAQFLRACADEKILLPLETFISVTTGSGREKCAELAEYTSNALPGVYTRLLDNTAAIESNPYVPAPSTTDDMRLWARKHANCLSLAPIYVDQRVKLAALQQLPNPSLRSTSDELVKTACNGGPAAKLAQEYALYKLAFLSAIPESDSSFPLTASLCVLQNYC